MTLLRRMQAVGIVNVVKDVGAWRWVLVEVDENEPPSKYSWMPRPLVKKEYRPKPRRMKRVVVSKPKRVKIADALLAATRSLHADFPDRASEGFNVDEIIQVTGIRIHRGNAGMRLSMLAQHGVVGHTIVNRVPHWSLNLSSMSVRQKVHLVLRNSGDKWFSCAGMAAEVGVEHNTAYYHLNRLAKDGYAKKTSGRSGMGFFQCKTSLPPERHASIKNRKDGYTRTKRPKFRGVRRGG